MTERLLAHGQPYAVPGEPGRFDINGVEWFACDPYPTWFRWEDTPDGPVLHTNPARWADLPPIDPADVQAASVMPPEECYGHDHHSPDCDQVIRTRWSGVSCDCRARWFCL